MDSAVPGVEGLVRPASYIDIQPGDLLTAVGWLDLGNCGHNYPASALFPREGFDRKRVNRLLRQDSRSPRDQILVTIQNIPPCHIVALIGDDPKFFKWPSSMPADSYASANREQNIGAFREGLKGGARVIPDSIHQVLIPPDIRAACAGIVARAQDLADLVVLETGSKHISRAVRQSIGYEHDRTVVCLADIIARLFGIKRKAAGIG